ncbi:MAG: hypothetical protein HY904_17210 [Deltaproteobacteria bacterium]|nr:hypothetical protein [Deltaproteobacteria bacterium]
MDSVQRRGRPSPWAALGLAALAGACGRVSFIGDGQVGDAGTLTAPSSSSSSGGGTSSSSLSSSSSSGGGASSSGGPGCTLGPAPVFAVIQQDVVTGAFANGAGGWNTQSCNTCHEGAGTAAGPAFNPQRPAPVANPAGAAASLTYYCQSVDGAPLETVRRDAGYTRLRLVCPLFSSDSTPAGDPCYHGVGPHNATTLTDYQALLAPCTRALDRYRADRSAWLDGGSAPPCDAGTPGPVEPGCPRAGLDPAWTAAWNKLDQNCTGCHGPNGFNPDARCFLMQDADSTHALMCGYARQDDGRLLPNAYATTRLARALHAENRRYACTTTAPLEHQSFLGTAEPDLQAWYEALFTAP